jgi:Ca2+-transporting ATPase
MLENRPFLLIVLAIVVGQVLIIQVGGEVFRTEPLSLVDWLKTAGLTALVAVTGEIIRYGKRQRAAVPAVPAT